MDVDDAGNIYFDNYIEKDKHSKTLKLTPDGKVSDFTSYKGVVTDIKFGPDGKLYAVEQGQVIHAIAPDGTKEVFADVGGADPVSAIAIDHKGNIYCVVSDKHKLIIMSPKKDKIEQEVDGLEAGNLTFTPDQGFLVANNYIKWQLSRCASKPTAGSHILNRFTRCRRLKVRRAANRRYWRSMTKAGFMSPA